MATPDPEPLRLIVGLSGSSALPVGLGLLDWCFDREDLELHTVFSEGAVQVARHEFSFDLLSRRGLLAELDREEVTCDWQHYDRDDLGAAISSGSFGVRKMVIAPCSMGTLSAVAQGHSDNLLERAADVTLKERGELVVVPREAPLSRIHLQNMLEVDRAGGVILPPMLTFYHGSAEPEAMVDFTVGKVLDVLEIDHELYRRWGT